MGTCLFSLIYSFVQSFLMSVWIHMYLFYALSSSAVPLYFLYGASCSSSGRWELFHEAPGFC